MAPKRGAKRKAATNSAAQSNGDEADLTPPDRTTWAGWVEMESEPAFFNAMLKDMGVRGVKMQEVFGLEPNDLAELPQPVHAFIFLFRYKDADMTQTETDCPQDVWFANQIPDFACASVAMLNVVNNIQGLQMGKEMRDFKTFTADLDPMARGDAIDGFDFLKRIHNSFARETDLLIADAYLRNKINKAKKRQATIQAQETKKAKKAAAGLEKPEKRADSAVTTPTRNSKRNPKLTTKKVKTKTEILDSEASSPLSDPPDSDPEFEAASKATKKSSSPAEQAPRRSGRQPKPRKDPTKLFSEAEVQPEDEGFHYLAYVPVNGKVWKMDGLDSFPHPVGEYNAASGGEWTNVAYPDIQARMMMFEGVIQYNLMAIVHDSVGGAKAELAANVRELQTIDTKLNKICDSWKEKEGANPDAHDVVVGPCPILSLDDEDLAAVPSPRVLKKQLVAHEADYVESLIQLRHQRVKAQPQLRGAVRDLAAFEDDGADEMVRMKRYDFGAFVKGWLGGLAEQEVLKELVDKDGE